MGASAPSSALYGYEVGSAIDKVKSIQKQCISALNANTAPVTLPTVADGDDPIKVLRKTNTAIMAAMIAKPVAFTLPTFGDSVKTIGDSQAVVNTPVAVASTIATLILKSAAPANLITITSKRTGEEGNAIKVTVAAGTASGKKVTITFGLVAEVFDNQADVPAVVASINNATTGSVYVTATQITTGTLADIAITNLAGGVDGVEADVRGNDGTLAAAERIAEVLFTAIRAKGYIY